MKIILPIEENPPVSYNPGVAQPLSILYSGVIKNPDLYLMDRYVQLYYDDYLGGTEKKILSFYIPGENYFNMLTMDTVEDEDIIDDNIISCICEEIKNGYYIQTMLQEYYIPGALFYNEVKEIHQHFIYGFDDDKRIFYFLCHKLNYRYGILEVSFDDFLLSYQRRETSPYAYVKIKPNKEVCLKREKDLYMRESLYDYIHSENRFVKQSEPTAYGMEIYNQLIEYLRAGFLDMRDYQALLQHKMVMYKRIGEYLKLSELAVQYKEILNLAIRAHYSALKWTRTKEDKIFQIIEKNLLKMKQQEAGILLDVYNTLKPPKKKLFSKTKKKDSTRPYSLETRVKDTLSDNEFWDILEEYVPGIRNNSQLPLVYGMRLKSIVGKGNYLGVTPEQEKECLERVLALKPKE